MSCRLPRSLSAMWRRFAGRPLFMCATRTRRQVGCTRFTAN
jgi:hypothetical protein